MTQLYETHPTAVGPIIADIHALQTSVADRGARLVKITLDRHGYELLAGTILSQEAVRSGEFQIFLPRGMVRVEREEAPDVCVSALPKDSA